VLANGGEALLGYCTAATFAVVVRDDATLSDVGAYVLEQARRGEVPVVPARYIHACIQRRQLLPTSHFNLLNEERSSIGGDDVDYSNYSERESGRGAEDDYYGGGGANGGDSGGSSGSTLVAHAIDARSVVHYFSRTSLLLLAARVGIEKIAADLHTAINAAAYRICSEVVAAAVVYAAHGRGGGGSSSGSPVTAVDVVHAVRSSRVATLLEQLALSDGVLAHVVPVRAAAATVAPSLWPPPAAAAAAVSGAVAAAVGSGGSKEELTACAWMVDLAIAVLATLTEHAVHLSAVRTSRAIVAARVTAADAAAASRLLRLGADDDDGDDDDDSGGGGCDDGGDGCSNGGVSSTLVDADFCRSVLCAPHRPYAHHNVDDAALVHLASVVDAVLQRVVELVVEEQPNLRVTALRSAVRKDRSADGASLRAAINIESLHAPRRVLHVHSDSKGNGTTTAFAGVATRVDAAVLPRAAVARLVRTISTSEFAPPACTLVAGVLEEACGALLRVAAARLRAAGRDVAVARDIDGVLW